MRGGANHFRAEGWNVSNSARALKPKTPPDCRSPLAGDPSFGPRSIRMATIASPASGLLRGARRRESLPCERLECLESASALKSKKSLDCRSPLAGDPSFSPRSISMATIASPASGLLRVRGGANRFRAEGWNVSNRLAPSSPKNHSIVGARLRAIRRSASPIHQNGHPRFARKWAPAGCAAARIASVRKAGMSRIGSPSPPKHHPIVGARLRAIRRSASPIHQNGHHRFARKRAPAGCTAARIASVRKVGISRIG
ncbi:hypothetical protein M2262_002193 [Pseudomonas sp. BIGb0408]|uniref:Uncharacterized protein n=1 Tax=Phytopseudomonas flavescens TaxID=29435 RepID=A0A7Y9XKZ9_9GAMM|nr:hypothetical protein [Pseudomonas sp. BIGb0408]NYH73285.1 hypothetical protein [Pseudomonas flavescens]